MNVCACARKYASCAFSSLVLPVCHASRSFLMCVGLLSYEHQNYVWVFLHMYRCLFICVGLRYVLQCVLRCLL